MNTIFSALLHSFIPQPQDTAAPGPTTNIIREKDRKKTKQINYLYY